MPISVIKFSNQSEEKIIAYKSNHMTISQMHSVSHTPIVEHFDLGEKTILLSRTEYNDQGGAGMPNEFNVTYSHGFVIDRQVEYQELFMILDEENDVEIDEKKYNFDGAYELKASQMTLLSYVLHRLGDL
jgi:hypothetical protein